MAEKQPSNVDQWLERETPRVRKALESASRYFDSNDTLTVNTLEAVYGQESSFGTMMGQRGSSDAVGHFHLKPETAKEYGLSVSKNNDQRFDIDRAASAAARYLKDLDTFFNKNTELFKGLTTVAVRTLGNGTNLFLPPTTAAKAGLPMLSVALRRLGKVPIYGPTWKNSLSRRIPANLQTTR